jgi:hypothetical protein
MMMRRMLVAVGLAVALAGCASGMGGGAAGVPMQFIGTWNGTGTQSDQPGEWSIHAVIVGGPVEQVGTISYPSLQCGGVLLLRSAGANWLEVGEDITHGQCVDQGIITLTPMAGDQLRFEWRLEGSDVTAQGVLTRGT